MTLRSPIIYHSPLGLIVMCVFIFIIVQNLIIWLRLLLLSNPPLNPQYRATERKIRDFPSAIRRIMLRRGLGFCNCVY